MKKLIPLLLIALLSCGKADDNLSATAGSVFDAPDRLFLDNSQQTHVYGVDANGLWSVEADESWINVTILDESINGSIRVVVQHNNTSDIREGYVRLNDGQSPGTILDVLIVVQAP